MLFTRQELDLADLAHHGRIGRMLALCLKLFPVACFSLYVRNQSAVLLRGPFPLIGLVDDEYPREK